MNIIAFVTDPVPVRSILSHLDLPTRHATNTSYPQERLSREYETAFDRRGVPVNAVVGLKITN